MSKTRPRPGRRVQALAYTLVTTTIVLVLALVEWATEKLVSDYSRAASTAIEIGVVLVAALVFRPIHQFIEKRVEALFYARKHHALASLQSLRHEFGSFSDARQLLRRAIEAIDHYLEASGTAIYVRRDLFRAEASSFDVVLENVELDDPLAIRFHASAAPARPKDLKSLAHGSAAFPLTSGGELVGFLTVDSKHGAFDLEETEMLSGLAQDLATALVGLDPDLRPVNRAIPNNLPADLTPIVGRERELREIQAALSDVRLLTLTGPGGVGKTRVALRCAIETMDEHEHGAWFVDLSPITDGALVASTILSAFDLQVSDEESSLPRLLEHLRRRNVLLVLDNCEHLIEATSSIASAVLTHCPHVTMIVTSRELLHLDGERVYRLGPLDKGTAVALFVQRATAVSAGFEWHDRASEIGEICEKLDGIPFAIELAAARVRAFGVADILSHLDERFRLLTNASREGGARHQTLEATIEWSYDLLPPEEQSLFLRLGVFRGSFSLPAAAAVCAESGHCDEFHILDVLTSLADKSLLNVTIGLSTRYRFLDTVRDFSRRKAVERQATSIVANQHAAYFSALAAHAYHEFDTQQPEGWLDALEPDIDNFRAALEWTLAGPGDRHLGAQLAADSSPIFLRMLLLGEGLQWCERALEVTPVDPATAGRIEYVASMLYNNLGDTAAGLACAERALTWYRQSSDRRGLVRTLSQVAQRYGQLGRFDESREPAEEAIAKGRELNDPRVLASILRRCAFGFSKDEIERSRALFAEAVSLAQRTKEDHELGLILQWWSAREAEIGDFERSMSLTEEGLPYASRDEAMYLHTRIAACALALGRFDVAQPHAAAALSRALETRHELLAALGMAYCSTFLIQDEPERARALFDYARARLEALSWTPEDEAKAAFDKIAGRLPDTPQAPSLSEDGALATAELALTVVGSGHSLTGASAGRGDAVLR